MCLTLEPSRMSGTILYAAETIFNGKLVHVMGYQNKAENLGSGPNAMLLPIPSASVMGPENAIDMRACKNVLKDYEQAYLDQKPRTRGLTKGLSDSMDFSRAAVQVFDSGSYTIVLARDANYINTALEQVPENKRPNPRPDIFGAYAKLYPGWHIALCCYDGAVEAEPMVWQYEPLDPAHLFAPALDGHDGKIPNMNVRVDRDHTIILSMVNRSKTRYAMELSRSRTASVIPPSHQYLFGKNFYGTQQHVATQNGDFIFRVADFNDDFNINYQLSGHVRPPPGVL